MAQGLTRFTAFSAANPVPSASLEGEFEEIHNSFDGTNSRALLVLYNNSDFATLEVDNTGGGDVQSWLVSNVEALKVNATGQVESVLSTGTAPFVVASTTKVDNLNGDLLDGTEAAAFSKGYHAAGVVGTGLGSEVSIRLPELHSGASSWTLSLTGRVITAATGTWTLEVGWVDADNSLGLSVLQTRNTAGITDPAVYDDLSSDLATALSGLLAATVGGDTIDNHKAAGDVFFVRAFSGTIAAEGAVAWKITQS